jgi:hypothetical protein
MLMPSSSAKKAANVLTRIVPEKLTVMVSLRVDRKPPVRAVCRKAMRATFRHLTGRVPPLSD